MKKYYYFIANFYIAMITSLLFTACTKESEYLSDKDVPSQKTDKVGEAIDFINDVFISDDLTNAAPGSTATPKVSFSKSTIDTIYDLPDEHNKPFLQLVVFKPKAYALISVIKKVKNPPVLFYSKQKFDIKKPSIGLINYLKEFLATSVRLKDALDGRPADNKISFIINTKTLSTSNTKEELGPLLKTLWYQHHPFNTTIVSKKGKKGLLVGCVAVAVGQIMAYHQKNNLKYYNWKKILASDNLDYIALANFFWDVAEGVNMNYGTHSQGGSGTNNNEAVKYFRSTGYTVNLINCQYSTIFKEIKQKRPVYLAAYAKRTYRGWLWSIFGQPYRYDNGHAWVTDGYRIVTSTKVIQEDKVNPSTGKVISTNTYTVSTTHKFLNMNWGWGYKAWCTYDYWRDGSDNYQYKKEMITVKP